LYRSRPFDAAILDVQMPTMDGLQAAAAIRVLEEGTGGRLPIIALTAHAMHGDRTRCLAAGADAYLAKPVDAGRLVELVESLARRWPREERTLEGAKEMTLEARPSGSHSQVDLEGSLTRLAGDMELFRKLAEFFDEDSPPLLAQIQAGLQQSDARLVERSAHTIKGLASNFGAEPTVQAALRVEELARGDNLAAAAEALPNLESQVQKLRESLAGYLDVESNS
jgi:CheY-like chemotaxis protein